MADLLDRGGLAVFDEITGQHVASGSVPGVVALVASDDEVHVATAGALAIGGSPVQRDSLFRIASVTKPIVGAAALALVAEGLFTLDEPIDRLVPELADRRVLRSMDGALDDTVPADRPITARDLLTFTFGFGVSVGMFMAERPWPIMAAERELSLCTFGPPYPARVPPADAWMAGLGSLPLMAQPGARWLYNTGASVLGVLLGRAASRPLAAVLESRLFEPLGMGDTSMWTSATDRLATAYAATPEGFEVWDPADGGAWSRPPSFEDGAAGLVSTVDDLLAFARMLRRRGDGLLPAELVAAMTTNQLRPEQAASDGGPILRGRGWGLCQSVITQGERAGAFGWDGGLGTTWLVDPVRDLTVIVMTQRIFSSPDPPQVHKDLQAAAYAALRA